MELKLETLRQQVENSVVSGNSRELLNFISKQNVNAETLNFILLNIEDWLYSQLSSGNEEFVRNFLQVIADLIQEVDFDVEQYYSFAKSLLLLVADENCSIDNIKKALCSLNDVFQRSMVVDVIIEDETLEGLIQILGRRLPLIGDFECQALMFEALYRITNEGNRIKWADIWFTEDFVKSAFLCLDPKHFEMDCRRALNFINENEPTKRVFSCIAHSVTFGSLQLKKPPGSDFWIDFNYDSQSISFYCEELHAYSNDRQSELWEIITISSDSVVKYKIEGNDGSKTKELILMLNCPCSYLLCSSNIEQSEENCITIVFTSFLDIEHHVKKIYCNTDDLENTRKGHSHNRKSSAPSDMLELYDNEVNLTTSKNHSLGRKSSSSAVLELCGSELEEETNNHSLSKKVTVTNHSLNKKSSISSGLIELFEAEKYQAFNTGMTAHNHVKNEKISSSLTSNKRRASSSCVNLEDRSDCIISAVKKTKKKTSKSSISSSCINFPEAKNSAASNQKKIVKKGNWNIADYGCKTTVRSNNHPVSPNFKKKHQAFNTGLVAHNHIKNENISSSLTSNKRRASSSCVNLEDRTGSIISAMNETKRKKSKSSISSSYIKLQEKNSAVSNQKKIVEKGNENITDYECISTVLSNSHTMSPNFKKNDEALNSGLNAHKHDGKISSFSSSNERSSACVNLEDRNSSIISSMKRDKRKKSRSSISLSYIKLPRVSYSPVSDEKNIVEKENRNIVDFECISTVPSNNHTRSSNFQKIFIDGENESKNKSFSKKNHLINYKKGKSEGDVTSDFQNIFSVFSNELMKTSASFSENKPDSFKRKITTLTQSGGPCNHFQLNSPKNYNHDAKKISSEFEKQAYPNINEHEDFPAFLTEETDSQVIQRTKKVEIFDDKHEDLDYITTDQPSSNLNESIQKQCNQSGNEETVQKSSTFNEDSRTIGAFSNFKDIVDNSQSRGSPTIKDVNEPSLKNRQKSVRLYNLDSAPMYDAPPDSQRKKCCDKEPSLEQTKSVNVNFGKTTLNDCLFDEKRKVDNTTKVNNAKSTNPGKAKKRKSSNEKSPEGNGGYGLSHSNDDNDFVTEVRKPRKAAVKARKRTKALLECATSEIFYKSNDNDIVNQQRAPPTHCLVKRRKIRRGVNASFTETETGSSEVSWFGKKKSCQLFETPKKSYSEWRKSKQNNWQPMTIGDFPTKPQDKNSTRVTTAVKKKKLTNNKKNANSELNMCLSDFETYDLTIEKITNQTTSTALKKMELDFLSMSDNTFKKISNKDIAECNNSSGFQEIEESSLPNICANSDILEESNLNLYQGETLCIQKSDILEAKSIQNSCMSEENKHQNTPPLDKELVTKESIERYKTVTTHGINSSSKANGKSVPSFLSNTTDVQLDAPVFAEAVFKLPSREISKFENNKKEEHIDILKNATLVPEIHLPKVEDVLSQKSVNSLENELLGKRLHLARFLMSISSSPPSLNNEKKLDERKITSCNSKRKFEQLDSKSEKPRKRKKNSANGMQTNVAANKINPIVEQNCFKNASLCNIPVDDIVKCRINESISKSKKTLGSNLLTDKTVLGIHKKNSKDESINTEHDAISLKQKKDISTSVKSCSTGRQSFHSFDLSIKKAQKKLLQSIFHVLSNDANSLTRRLLGTVQKCTYNYSSKMEKLRQNIIATTEMLRRYPYQEITKRDIINLLKFCRENRIKIQKSLKKLLITGQKYFEAENVYNFKLKKKHIKATGIYKHNMHKAKKKSFNILNKKILSKLNCFCRQFMESLETC